MFRAVENLQAGAAKPVYRPARALPQAPSASITGNACASGAPGFKAGDSINHKAFGDGVVVAVKPMGNDSLIEIVFDGAGTKRLMYKFAAEHMKKI